MAGVRAGCCWGGSLPHRSRNRSRLRSSSSPNLRERTCLARESRQIRALPPCCGCPKGATSSRATLAGHNGAEATAEVRPGQETPPVTFRLSATTGRVRINTDPPGAAVLVDEQPLGVAPVEASLPVGEHRLEVQRDGTPNYRATFEIQSGETKSLVVQRAEVRVQEKKPTVQRRLMINPPDALVKINGRTMPVQEGTVAWELPEGDSVVLDIEAEGHRRLRRGYLFSELKETQEVQLPRVVQIKPRPRSVTVNGKEYPVNEEGEVELPSSQEDRYFFVDRSSGGLCPTDPKRDRQGIEKGPVPLGLAASRRGHSPGSHREWKARAGCSVGTLRGERPGRPRSDGRGGKVGDPGKRMEKGSAERSRTKESKKESKLGRRPRTLPPTAVKSFLVQGLKNHGLSIVSPRRYPDV